MMNKELLELNAKIARMCEIKNRLNALTEDIVQSMVGEVIPDIEARKAEFVTLHNELRTIEGKEAREVVSRE